MIERRRSPASGTRDPLDQAVINAKAAVPNSPAAIEAGQEAVFHLVQSLRPTISDVLAGNGRAAWIRALAFLRETLSFPAIDDLLLALEEQERGFTNPALERPKVAGGIATTNMMMLRRNAVEAAQELKARCSCDEEYRAELRGSESSYSTIEKWKGSLKGAAPHLRPRVGFRLHWGEVPPEILLQRTVWAMRTEKQLPREPRKVTG